MCKTVPVPARNIKTVPVPEQYRYFSSVVNLSVGTGTGIIFAVFNRDAPLPVPVSVRDSDFGLAENYSGRPV
jgi:hypothetical protein